VRLDYAWGEALATYIPKRYLEAHAQLKRGKYDVLFEEISSRELEFYA
jgi:hypothetical protein